MDGTARPQIVRAEEQPELHETLTLFGQQIGVPALINTSFNMHEEPMVRTASDAIRAWQAAKLDALWLGSYLLEL